LLLALEAILIIVFVRVLTAINIPNIIDNQAEVLIVFNRKRYITVVLHEFFKSNLAVLAIPLHDVQGVFKSLEELNEHLVCRALA